MSPGNRGEQNVLNFETVKPDLKKKKKAIFLQFSRTIPESNVKGSKQSYNDC